jgi:Cu+-exporting ATPase
MVTDPVCKMQIDESKNKLALTYKERTYYFCSEGCRAEFQRHREEYADSNSADKERRERV